MALWASVLAATSCRLTSYQQNAYQLPAEGLAATSRKWNQTRKSLTATQLWKIADSWQLTDSYVWSESSIYGYIWVYMDIYGSIWIYGSNLPVCISRKKWSFFGGLWANIVALSKLLRPIIKHLSWTTFQLESYSISINDVDIDILFVFN